MEILIINRVTLWTQLYQINVIQKAVIKIKALFVSITFMTSRPDKVWIRYLHRFIKTIRMLS